MCKYSPNPDIGLTKGDKTTNSHVFYAHRQCFRCFRVPRFCTVAKVCYRTIQRDMRVSPKVIARVSHAMAERKREAEAGGEDTATADDQQT